MEILTRITLFFMVILSVSGQNSTISRPSALPASTLMASGFAPGSVAGTSATPAASVASTAARAQTSGLSTLPGAAAQTTMPLQASTLSSTANPPNSATITGAGAAATVSSPIVSVAGSRTVFTSSSVPSSVVLPSQSSAFRSETSSLPLQSSTSSTTATTSPGTTSSATTSSATTSLATNGSSSSSPSPTTSSSAVVCSTTSDPVTCVTETCCTGSKGAWTGVNKAASVKYNQTVHCTNGNTTSATSRSCEQACIKKECDGASAIVVGHVFAACLTFAVFWIITE